MLQYADNHPLSAKAARFTREPFAILALLTFKIAKFRKDSQVAVLFQLLNLSPTSLSQGRRYGDTPRPLKRLRHSLCSAIGVQN
jgi:hypothetical protein